jgi:hypothetical protein
MMLEKPLKNGTHLMANYGYGIIGNIKYETKMHITTFRIIFSMIQPLESRQIISFKEIKQ